MVTMSTYTKRPRGILYELLRRATFVYYKFENSFFFVLPFSCIEYIVEFAADYNNVRDNLKMSFFAFSNIVIFHY